jgi:hypothetical protein
MPGILSFEIISQTVLSQVAGIIVPIIVSSTLTEIQYIKFFTSETGPQSLTNSSGTFTANLIIIPVNVPDTEYYKYSVTITATVGQLPRPMGVVSANQVGIGELSIVPPVPA